MELATHDPAIKNSLDFELFMVIDDLGRRGGSRATTGERIRKRKGELDNGEDGMEAAHGKREFELVGSMADTRSDFEGPKVSMGEFCRWSGGANIAHVYQTLSPGFRSGAGSLQ